MIIEKIEIGKFGIFENAVFEFTSGVNMIEGGNESGKSTIADFIKFIFYGLSNEEEPLGSEWQRYLVPFKKAEGSLWLTCSKGNFRIDRSIDVSVKRVSAETVEIVDLQKNAPIRGKDPAALFLGVSKEIFERSYFMAQLEKRQVLPIHLGAAVENMLSSADESVSAEKSAAALQNRIDLLQSEEEGSVSFSKARTAELEKRLARAISNETEYIRLQESVKESGKKSANNKKEYEDCRRRLEHAEAQRKIALVNRAGGAASDLQRATQELRNAKEELSENGFLPDRSYVKGLSGLLSDVLRAEDSGKDASARLEDDRARLKELPAPAGGEEGELLSAISSREQKASSAKNFAIMAAGAAALLLALCILFIFLKIAAGAIVCGALALAGVGIAVWFFFGMKREIAERDALYDDSGSVNKEELALAVSRNARLVAERESLEKSVEEGVRLRDKYTAALESLLTKAAEQAARWGKSCKDTDELKSLCVQAEDAYERIDRLTNDEKQAKLAFSALEVHVTEEELTFLRDLLANDGIEEELDDAAYKDLTVKAKFYKQTSEALDGRIAAQNKQMKELESAMEDRYLLEEDIARQKEHTAVLLEELAVKKAARNAILESVAYMRAQILPGIMKSASTFFNTASAGKYVRLEANADFSVTAYGQDGQGVPMSAFSGAVKELCYMALRFAVTEHLQSESPLPVVLDESFSGLDDLHLAAAFRAVYERAAAGKNQIILMTCRKRETALMEMIGEINKIRLS